MDNLIFQIVKSKSFKKDFKKLSNAEKSDTLNIISKLAKGEPLEEKYRDHQLVGELKSFRDCHVRPDLILIYKYNNTELELYLLRIGSHSKLLKI